MNSVDKENNISAGKAMPFQGVCDTNQNQFENNSFFTQAIPAESQGCDNQFANNINSSALPVTVPAQVPSAVQSVTGAFPFNTVNTVSILPAPSIGTTTYQTGSFVATPTTLPVSSGMPVGSAFPNVTSCPISVDVPYQPSSQQHVQSPAGQVSAQDSCVPFQEKADFVNSAIAFSNQTRREKHANIIIPKGNVKNVRDNFNPSSFADAENIVVNPVSIDANAGVNQAKNTTGTDVFSSMNGASNSCQTQMKEQLDQQVQNKSFPLSQVQPSYNRQQSQSYLRTIDFSNNGNFMPLKKVAKSRRRFSVLAFIAFVLSLLTMFSVVTLFINPFTLGFSCFVILFGIFGVVNSVKKKRYGLVLSIISLIIAIACLCIEFHLFFDYSKNIDYIYQVVNLDSFYQGFSFFYALPTLIFN